MENKEMINHLESLVKLDIDAVHAYDAAIENIDLQNVREKLTDFKRDHERHVSDLSESIRKLGGEPPEFSKDFKGFLIEGFTKVRSATGTEGALKAMKTNEDLTNKMYNDALSFELPEDVKNIVRKNYDDEKRHLQYIEQCISDKVWEKAA